MSNTITRIMEKATRAYHAQRDDTAVIDIPAALKAEQYLMGGLRTIMDNGVAVVIPPLHHEVVTAKLRIDPTRSELQHAQKQLEHVLSELNVEFPATPAGLAITIGWGLPYFWTRVPGPAEQYLPVNNWGSAAAGKTVLAIQDAIRFPSDPEDVILEDNDVVVLLRSDSLDNIATGSARLFKEKLDFWEVTSIRKGFIGGGFDGATSLPKLMAMEAGIPGAEHIPETAQMFMGFTSSQKAALGGDMIANFETVPGLTDQWPSGYFRCGTTMHLSHLYEDLEAWYTKYSYQDRVSRAFRAGLQGVADGTQTVPEGPTQIDTEDECFADLEKHRVVGHSAALQPATRLPTDLVDNYGNFYPAGTAVPNRADFNTLDNPFFWTTDPIRDRWKETPAAGLHFAVFVPASGLFHRGRLAMDGHYADGRVLGIDPRSPHQGMNAVTAATHRQNFLVPPMAHRSFPLAELL